MMTSSAREIDQQAAIWLVRTESTDCTPEEHAECAAWLAADRRHLAAFLRLREVWNRSNRLKFFRPVDGRIDDDVLRPREDIEWELRPSTPAPRSRWTGGWIPVSLAAAAMTLLVAGALAILWVVNSTHALWEVHSTPVGGFKRVLLTDGSTMLLNTDTVVRTRFTETGRLLELVRGEAIFTVTHDSSRPFDVFVGSTKVRAVGTQFSVRNHGNDWAEVLVTEGRVAIDPPRPALAPKVSGITPAAILLSEGNGAIVWPSGIDTRNLSPEEIQRRLAWRAGLLSFEGETLVEVTGEFNRHNNRKLMLADSAITALPIGGSFQSTDPMSFLEAMEGMYPIRVVREHHREDGSVTFWLGSTEEH